jgi:predicted MFS family arabinose efflux permease
MLSNNNSKLKKVSPDSMIARIFLAFLSTAGIFYVNILPALVNGLITALGFSNQQAGAVASANLYGAAFGALLIVFLVKKLNWKKAALVFLLGLIAVDFASILVTNATTMTALRFADGFIGGMLVGTGFSVIARTHEPDRTFGVLLFVQFGLGGLGVMVLPDLVDQFGTKVLFLTLIAFSTVTLAMLPFLPDYPVEGRASGAGTTEKTPIQRIPLLLTLFAIFLFQAANNALYAYIIGLGEHFGQEGAMITTTLGVAAWLGLVGAGLVVMLSDHFGYVKSLTAGMIVTIVGTWAFLHSDTNWIWITANCLIGITWAFTISYLLGLASRFDLSGQMAAVGGFASKMGLASGPAVAAMILGENNYVGITWTAVVALVLSLGLVLRPAHMQDRKLT